MGFWQRNACECISGSSHDLSTPPMLAVKLQSARYARHIRELEKCVEVGCPMPRFPPGPGNLAAWFRERDLQIAGAKMPDLGNVACEAGFKVHAGRIDFYK